MDLPAFLGTALFSLTFLANRCSRFLVVDTFTGIAFIISVLLVPPFNNSRFHLFRLFLLLTSSGWTPIFLFWTRRTVVVEMPFNFFRLKLWQPKLWRAELSWPVDIVWTFFENFSTPLINALSPPRIAECSFSKALSKVSTVNASKDSYDVVVIFICSFVGCTSFGEDWTQVNRYILTERGDIKHLIVQSFVQTQVTTLSKRYSSKLGQFAFLKGVVPPNFQFWDKCFPWWKSEEMKAVIIFLKNNLLKPVKKGLKHLLLIMLIMHSVLMMSLTSSASCL